MKQMTGSWLWASAAAVGIVAAGLGAEEREGVRWPPEYVPVVDRVELPSARIVKTATVETAVRRLPALEVAALLAEDEASTDWGRPPRVGVNRSLDEPLDGRWYDSTDGGRIWTAAIAAEGASELRIHFTKAHLPPGAELYVYSPGEPHMAVGPVTGSGPRSTGEFWSSTVTGDTAYIEYFDPSGKATNVPFTVDEVAHFYRHLAADAEGSQRDATSWSDCMVDIACEPTWPTWEDMSYSVARITYYADDPGSSPGWYICTGTLLATENADLTPYFLTSAHCVDEQSEAETVEFRWFYQHSTCGGGFMSSRYRDDADLLGTSGRSLGADWSLLMAKGVLPAGVFWSGWTTSDPSAGTWSVGIHHPNNYDDWKRWSRGQRYSGAYIKYHQLRFNVAGGVGHIYFGSSGSGIWREDDQKLFGNLSFGTGEPGCDHLSVSAYYGQFASYYPTIASLLAAGSDDSLDDNDDCASATTLDSGVHQDLVVKSVDEDWYRIPVGWRSELDVDLSFMDFHGNINAELYDSCGGSIVASAAGFTNNESLTYVNLGPATDLYLRVYLGDDTRNTYEITSQVTSTARPEPTGTEKNRYISMVIPQGLGEETAIRVQLTSLHHPAEPADAPDFGAWEGAYRWVNALDETLTCPESPNFPGVTFRCAVLGCYPEYRNWSAELSGEALHVTGAAVMPSSLYDVAQLSSTCQGNEASCTAVSEAMSAFSATHGDVDPLTDALVVLDIARVVDHIKGIPGAPSKPSAHLRPNVPNALNENVGVLDVATAVDAVKGNAYWHFGDFGPCTDSCPGEAACP